MMRYPLQAELEYRTALYEVVAEIRNEMTALVNVEGPSIVENASEFRADAIDDLISFANSVTSLVNRVRLKVATPVRFAVDKLDSVASKIVFVGRAEWQRVLMAAYGRNQISPEPWVPPIVNAWKIQNKGMVMDLADNTVRRIKDRMMESLRIKPTLNGLRVAVSSQIEIGNNSADFIARDQTAKLHAILVQEREKHFGVQKYIWRTMRDELVRATHAAHEGKLFSWAVPPEGTGHPGEDYGCRCWPEPVMPVQGYL